MAKANNTTRNFIIISLTLLVLVFLLIVFGLKSAPKAELNTMTYNFFTFEEIGGFWETDIQLDDQLYRAAFRFNPKQVEDVEIRGNFTGFKTEPIYITFDPDVEREEFKYLALATTELSLHLIRALNYSVEAACTKNLTEACRDRPIVNCGDNASVIYIVSKPPTQISLEGSCVKLSGDGFNLVRSVDRLLYQWYKIMMAAPKSS